MPRASGSPARTSQLSLYSNRATHVHSHETRADNRSQIVHRPRGSRVLPIDPVAASVSPWHHSRRLICPRYPGARVLAVYDNAHRPRVRPRHTDTCDSARWRVRVETRFGTRQGCLYGEGLSWFLAYIYYQV